MEALISFDLATEMSETIVSQLIQQGFDAQTIDEGIKNVQTRNAWRIGSLCSIYSRKKSQWFDAQITDITTDEITKQKWLTVRYNGKNTKKIQHFNKNIKPMNTEHND